MPVLTDPADLELLNDPRLRRNLLREMLREALAHNDYRMAARCAIAIYRIRVQLGEVPIGRN